MTIAILWFVGFGLAACLLWKVRSVGLRRFVVSITLIAVAATGGGAAYVWRSSEIAATAAAERVISIRQQSAAAGAEVANARRIADVRQALREANDAVGAFFGTGSRSPSIQRSDEDVLVAEGAVVSARASLAEAERVAASQPRGWLAVSPILIWGGVAYLAALAALVLNLWTRAGFAAPAATHKPGARKSTNANLNTRPSRAFGRVRGKLPLVPIIAGVVVLVAAAAVVWAVQRPNSGKIVDTSAVNALARPVSIAEPVAPSKAEAASTATDAKPVSPPETPASLMRPTASWLAGWWSQDGFCEGDAGETFTSEGTWGQWGIDGRWELTGDRLKVTKITRVADTESGQPEPIDPPETQQGNVTSITKDSFVWMGRHMVRCEET